MRTMFASQFTFSPLTIKVYVKNGQFRVISSIQTSRASKGAMITAFLNFLCHTMLPMKSTTIFVLPTPISPTTNTCLWRKIFFVASSCSGRGVLRYGYDKLDLFHHVVERTLLRLSFLSLHSEKKSKSAKQHCVESHWLSTYHHHHHNWGDTLGQLCW